MAKQTEDLVRHIWHEMAAERAIDALHADKGGLSSEESVTRLET